MEVLRPMSLYLTNDLYRSVNTYLFSIYNTLLAAYNFNHFFLTGVKLCSVLKRYHNKFNIKLLTEGEGVV